MSNQGHPGGRLAYDCAHQGCDRHLQGRRPMIRPIQYLRGIAALSVVWLHALTMMDAFTAEIGPPRFGSSGVHIFFVISGFIMFMTTAGKPMAASEFMRLRIIRVVPL